MSRATSIIIGNVWIVGAILYEGPTALRVTMGAWGLALSLGGAIWAIMEQRA